MAYERVVFKGDKPAVARDPETGDLVHFSPHLKLADHEQEPGRDWQPKTDPDRVAISFDPQELHPEYRQALEGMGTLRQQLHREEIKLTEIAARIPEAEQAHTDASAGVALGTGKQTAVDRAAEILEKLRRDRDQAKAAVEGLKLVIEHKKQATEQQRQQALAALEHAGRARHEQAVQRLDAALAELSRAIMEEIGVREGVKDALKELGFDPMRLLNSCRPLEFTSGLPGRVHDRNSNYQIWRRDAERHGYDLPPIDKRESLLQGILGRGKR